MAREIDLDKELSDEDRQYLVDRDRWHAIARADGHGDPRRAKAEHVAGAPAPTQVSLPPTDPQAPARTLADLAGELDDEEDASELPYEEWSYDELKAELDARRADAVSSGMTEQDAAKRYSKGGGQKDLVARLKADDEDQAEDPQ